MDGNKRAAVLAVAVFLALNGRSFNPAEEAEVRTMLALAAGGLEEDEFASWVASNTR